MGIIRRSGAFAGRGQGDTGGRHMGNQGERGLTCALCSREPEDWCPACKQPLCAEHSLPHVPSFDSPCQDRPPSGSDAQYARMMDAWDHHIPSAEELERGWPDTEDET